MKKTLLALSIILGGILSYPLVFLLLRFTVFYDSRPGPDDGENMAALFGAFIIGTILLLATFLVALYIITVRHEPASR